MLGGGRLKKQTNNPKTTNSQLRRAAEAACEQDAGGSLCVTEEETGVFLYKHKGQLGEGRETARSWKGILVSYSSSWQKQMELAQYHAENPFLIFVFPFLFGWFFFFFPPPPLFCFLSFVLWAGSLASKDNFPWTPRANRAVFLLGSVYKTK